MLVPYASPVHALRRPRPLLALLVVGIVLAGCGADTDVGEERADQTRDAAAAAGLPDEVGDFLALAARGQTSTYVVTYPGDDGTRIAVAADGADRRIDLLANGDVTGVQLVIDGEGFECPRDPDAGTFACTKTDAFVAAPGQFDTDALAALTEGLSQAVDDYTFTVETTPIAGVDAQCLVTRIRAGRERAELGASGTLCVSAEGAVLRVDRSGETLTATDYSTTVPDNTFVRPDLAEPDESTTTG